MAAIRKKYKDLNDTLKHIRLQIEESIPYAQKVSPRFRKPLDIYTWLKPQLKYKHDPKDTELLQSYPTLMNQNFHGISGQGDCDCFVITVCSLCKAAGFKNIWIKLAGRNKNTAVHIWSGVDINGKEYALDMTNKLPHTERNYPYIQKIYLKTLKKSY